MPPGCCSIVKLTRMPGLIALRSIDGATGNSMVIVGQPISGMGLWVRFTLCCAASTEFTVPVPWASLRPACAICIALCGPVNVLRVALHPNGLAPRTVNLAEWRAHLLARLRHQIELTADPELIKLLNELQRYPVARSAKPPPAPPGAAIVLPFQLQTEHGIVTLISTVTVFGTPIDVTVAELALECFYPADAATADILQRAAAIRRDFRARSGTVSPADGRHSDMQ